MAKDLRRALVELQAFNPPAPEDRIIFSERDIGISPKALAIWFLTLYRDLGFNQSIRYYPPWPTEHRPQRKRPQTILASCRATRRMA
jgi:hypothetical protein